jgi:hypothetical protein
MSIDKEIANMRRSIEIIEDFLGNDYQEFKNDCDVYDNYNDDEDYKILGDFDVNEINNLTIFKKV